MVTATSRPGWPPGHEWAARTAAAALAAEAGRPIVDVFSPQVLDVGRAIRTLPDEQGRIRLADWVQVPQSPGPLGFWLTTKGLGRFGLPELQTENVPPQLIRPDQAATVRLIADPAPEPHADSFCTILPPDDYQASAGEFLAGLCATLSGGQAESEIRRVGANDAMATAMATARDGLPAEHGTEYVWTFVSSWADPGILLGSYANDAESDPAVRVGRPATVPAVEVVDWGIWVDGQGLVEGGWTQQALGGQ